MHQIKKLGREERVLTEGANIIWKKVLRLYGVN